MVDLEQAISGWRLQMAAKGIQAVEVLVELESHLSEGIERQMQCGATEERAYDVARAHVGEPGVLRPEFAKLTATNRRTRFLEASCIVFAPSSAVWRFVAAVQAG